jgi:hypothetical protein
MDSPAKTATLLYAINVATGIFSLQYVPSRSVVSGGAAATFNRPVASESLLKAA